jgi:hypothetical protein
MLQTFTVEDSTFVLLKKLQQIPMLNGLRLVGGTALALQLGHRHSIDLDLFGEIDVDSRQIAKELESNDLDVIIDRETDSIKMFRINGVKVDIVKYPVTWLEPSIETEEVRMAGLKDIAGMKLNAVANRGTKKDFVDFYFLLHHFSLEQMLDFFVEKYPRNSLFAVVKSLTYFEDAEKDAMPKMFTKVSWEKIKSKIGEAVKKIKI